MTQRKKSPGKQKVKNSKSKSREPFKLINPDAAGIDIGSATHWVAVPADRDEQPVKSFGCFTADLHALADWLQQCGITTVAMESTGVYWIPIFQILERRGFEVKLVNSRHVKQVPGRKSDVSDCQWLQRLHSFGLLNGSFRPEDQVCVLRSYWRHRDNLIRYASAHVQHMQKALVQMNLHLHKVLSDITGETGMRILRAILAGERDPMVLAQMKDRRVKRSDDDIAKSLQGDYREEHLFALRQALESYDFYYDQIRRCDVQIEQCIEKFTSKDTAVQVNKSLAKPRRSQPHVDLRSHLCRITGVDFTQIDGLDVSTVFTIISEVGLDPNAFRNAKSFASWLGLCPDNRITGGKIKSSKTRKVVNRATTAFRLAAQTQARSSSALGGYYRRIRARLGAPKAITATAHKLARIFYTLWKSGKPYEDKGADYYEKKYKERVLRTIKKKAQQLGYTVTLEPLAHEVS